MREQAAAGRSEVNRGLFIGVSDGCLSLYQTETEVYMWQRDSGLAVNCLLPITVVC